MGSIPPRGPTDGGSQPRFPPEVIRAYEEEKTRRQADERRVVALALPILLRHFELAGLAPRPDFQAAATWSDVAVHFERLAEALPQEPPHDEALKRLVQELTDFSLANPDDMGPHYRLALLLRGWVWRLPPEARTRLVPAAAASAIAKIDDWILDAEERNPQSYY